MAGCANCFVNMDVLVYVRDSSEPRKQAAAVAWMRALWANRSGRVSFQVLSEYYVAVTEKLRPGLDRDQAWADIRNLMAWAPVPTDQTVIEGARTIQDRHGLSWWDSLVVSSAQVAGCAWILTEDLEHGRTLDGLRVVDPFRMPPDKILGGAAVEEAPGVERVPGEAWTEAATARLRATREHQHPDS